MSQRPEHAHHVDLVFEGGGVKGIGLAGAVATLETHGYRPQNVAGTSAGAISASLLAAGYSADELREIIMNLDYRQFEDKGWEDKVPVVDRSLSLLLDLGIYEGRRFFEWIRELLAAKGVTTFADLVHPEYADDPLYRWRLQVIASDVTSHELLVLPRDAHKLGIEPDRLNVALAVRMSMSIPYFFTPVRVTNTLGQRCYIVDGGLLSNFPIELFDTPPPAVPAWPTFGFALVSDPTEPTADVRVESKVRGLLTLFAALFHTAVVAHDAHAMAVPDVAARTMRIDDLGIPPTQFDLTQAQKVALYHAGQAAARDFLAT